MEKKEANMVAQEEQVQGVPEVQEVQVDVQEEMLKPFFRIHDYDPGRAK